MAEQVVFLFKTLFDMLLQFGETVIDFSNLTIAEVTRTFGFGVVAEIVPTLYEITILQAMFGLGVPVVLCYAIIAWVIDVLP